MSKDKIDPQYQMEAHLVLIFGSDKLKSKDGLDGLHTHLVERNLYDRISKIAPKPLEGAKQLQIPPGVMLLHGTISGLFAGKFETGINGEDARLFGQLMVGIASTNAYFSRDGKPVKVVNNEAVIINGVAVCAGHDGKGRMVEDKEEYAYLQISEAKDVLEIKEQQQCKDEKDVLKYVKEQVKATEGTSFVAVVPVTLDKRQLNLKTINGTNKEGVPYKDFKGVLDGHRQWTEKDKAPDGTILMPDVAHVNSLNVSGQDMPVTIQAGAKIRYGIIEKAMVHDPELKDIPKKPSNPHIKIGNRVYGESLKETAIAR